MKKTLLNYCGCEMQLSLGSGEKITVEPDGYWDDGTEATRWEEQGHELLLYRPEFGAFLARGARGQMRVREDTPIAIPARERGVFILVPHVVGQLLPTRYDLVHLNEDDEIVLHPEAHKNSLP